jgi:hypothetical protein
MMILGKTLRIQRKSNQLGVCSSVMMQPLSDLESDEDKLPTGNAYEAWKQANIAANKAYALEHFGLDLRCQGVH